MPFQNLRKINHFVPAKNNFRTFHLPFLNLRKINHFDAAKNNFRTFNFAVTKSTKKSFCGGEKQILEFQFCRYKIHKNQSICAAENNFRVSILLL